MLIYTVKGEIVESRARNVVKKIARLPQDWHGAGTVSHLVLETIFKYVEAQGEILRSVETGSGKTTLLLSHLSKHHTVFACDFGDSIGKVKGSSLFRPECVTFVEGPTQQTLPVFTFDEPLDLVLIDGPHGYPFPDLEYYYFYPHIKRGGLLLVDDIQIPTIGRMVDILKADDMFEFLETVDNMAFFRRTPAPLFDPLGDNWWIQGYNKAVYDDMMKVEPDPKPEPESKGPTEGPRRQTPSFIRLVAKHVPGFAKAFVPRRLKRWLLGK
jgi:hypothetical protein